MDRTGDSTWIGPTAWVALTAVLTVITLTLDPLWSYYGSWAAGFMTAFAVIRREISLSERHRLDSENETLLLEVREARTREGNGRLPAEVDSEPARRRAEGDDSDST